MLAFEDDWQAADVTLLDIEVSMKQRSSGYQVALSMMSCQMWPGTMDSSEREAEEGMRMTSKRRTYSTERDADTPNLPAAMHEARPQCNTSLRELLGQDALCIALSLKVPRKEEACRHTDPSVVSEVGPSSS